MLKITCEVFSEIDLEFELECDCFEGMSLFWKFLSNIFWKSILESTLKINPEIT